MKFPDIAEVIKNLSDFREYCLMRSSAKDISRNTQATLSTFLETVGNELNDESVNSKNSLLENDRFPLGAEPSDTSCNDIVPFF